MTLVVEIGVNQESVDDFKDMIDASIDAGALLLKGQLYADRHIRGRSDYKKVKKAMRDEYEASVLMEYARERGAELFWTPEDMRMVSACEDLAVKYYKIGAKDWRNREFMTAVGLTMKPTIQSQPIGAFSKGVILSAPHPSWHEFCCWTEYDGNPPMRKLIPELKMPQCRGASLHANTTDPHLIGWAITGSCEVHFGIRARDIDRAVSIGIPQLRALIDEARELGIDQRLRGFGRSI